MKKEALKLKDAYFDSIMIPGSGNILDLSLSSLSSSLISNFTVSNTAAKDSSSLISIEQLRSAPPTTF